MKKVLLTLVLLFGFVFNVNASVSGSVGNIKIEDIKIEIQDDISYNEEVEIDYSINPRDASNKNLVWSVTGVKKGVTVEFTSSKNTNVSDGTLSIKVNNTTDENVTLKLIAKQNNKTISTTSFTVESKEYTITRITREVNELISSLDEEINKNNYEENKEILEEIEELLKDEEIRELIDEESIEKYENVNELVLKQEKKLNKNIIKIISIVLIVIFAGVIFFVFLKEDKNDSEVKVETKKEAKKKEKKLNKKHKK